MEQLFKQDISWN